jgi:hypothetical protein
MNSLARFLESAVDDTRYRAAAIVVALGILLVSGGFLIASTGRTPSKILSAPAALPEQPLNLPYVRYLGPSTPDVVTNLAAVKPAPAPAKRVVAQR